MADKLKGKEFKNFDEFRSAFWKAVAEDNELLKQFSPSNQAAIKKGYAPTAKENQWLGERTTYEIHHKIPIHDGGDVYNMDNMVILTPRYHKEILNPNYHYKKQ
ncbi:MAG: HNH endonuclease signature motif containing protein [Microscillaceae bacterium]|nr:HNH endonuclease signature motif containing protein [Microscillaceae bacterium]